MTDLVTRLREVAENIYSPNAVDVIREATREVEDLKAQLGNLRFLYDGAQIDIKRIEQERDRERESHETCQYRAIEQKARAEKAEAEAAALQSRLNEANADRDHLEHKVAQLEARVKKLEAVAEAVVECRKIDRIVMGDIMTPTVINMSPFKRLEEALAALEEKP